MELANINLLAVWIIFVLVELCKGIPIQNALSSGRHLRQVEPNRTPHKISSPSHLYRNKIHTHPLTVVSKVPNTDTEIAQARAEQYKLHNVKPVLKGAQKTIIKRDTASLKDLRKDLNKLFLHQLQKQVLTTSHPVMNNLPGNNNFNNIPNFMTHFLNDKSNLNKSPTKLIGGILSKAHMNHFRSAPAAKIKEKARLVGVRDPNIHSHSLHGQLAPMNVELDGHKIEQASNHARGNAAKFTNFTQTSTTATPNNGYNVPHGTTKMPSLEDFQTTITRHYHVVQPTKRKHLAKSTKAPGFRNIQNVTPTMVHQNRHFTKKYPSDSTPARLKHDRKESFRESPFDETRENMITSAFTKIPQTKDRQHVIFEKPNAFTLDTPLVTSRIEAGKSRIPNIYPKPTPTLTPYTKVVSKTVSDSTPVHSKHDRKENLKDATFDETSTNMITSAFTRVPQTKHRQFDINENYKAYVSDPPVFTPQKVIGSTQIPNINPKRTPTLTPNIKTPSPTLTMDTQTTSLTLTKTGIGSNSIKIIQKVPISTTVSPTRTSFDQSPEKDMQTDRMKAKTLKTQQAKPKVHHSTLINLQGIHILFTNDKPNYTAISKHPTLHLTASVKKPLNDANLTQHRGNHTASIKTSANDVQFSTSSKDKYVGTAVIRNGHLFLVVYPPERVYRQPHASSIKTNSIHESTTKHHVHRHATKAPNANIATSAINIPSLTRAPTSATTSKKAVKVLSTAKHRNHLHSLLIPAITDSIMSSLNPYTTIQSNAAYHHSTVTVRMPTTMPRKHARHHKLSFSSSATNQAGGQKASDNTSGTSGTIEQTSQLFHQDISTGSIEHSRHQTSTSRSERNGHNQKQRVNDHLSEHIVTTASDRINFLKHKPTVKLGHIHQPYTTSYPAERIHEHINGDDIKTNMPNEITTKHSTRTITHLNKTPAKATDPFQRIYGFPDGHHSMHNGHLNTGGDTTTEADGHGSHGLARFNSPWKNVDLSSVLPKFPHVQSQAANKLGNNSIPNVNVYSFVAKATDPFDRIQSILNKLRATEQSYNRTGDEFPHLSDDTSFNFELTVQSEGTSDKSKHVEEDSNSSNAKNDTRDELLKLLSSTIHHAAKTYDMEMNRDKILQKMSELSKLDTFHLAGNDEHKTPIGHNFQDGNSETTSLNDKYTTISVIKRPNIGESPTVSIRPTMSVSTADLSRTVPQIRPQTYTTNNVLPIPMSQEVYPTKSPGNLNTRNRHGAHHIEDNGITKVQIKKTMSSTHGHGREVGISRDGTLPPDILHMIAHSNMTESDRRRYIRTQIVHDIIKTKPMHPTTPTSRKMVPKNFQKPHVQQPRVGTRKTMLQELMAGRQHLNKNDRGINDLFAKRQLNRTETQHEMPLSKALYLIKQQTNELRSQKALETLTRRNQKSDFNNDFNAMLILSIDDILSDHTNLHGALVVSFLTKNTNRQGHT